MSRSLMFDVAAMAIHLKACTVDDLQDKFPNLTRHQIQDALHNAAYKGIVKCLKRGSRANLWGPADMTPGDYKPAPRRQKTGAISSVWELGTQKTVTPSARRGTVYRLLGE